jgi:hypothetical protein
MPAGVWEQVESVASSAKEQKKKQSTTTMAYKISFRMEVIGERKARGVEMDP